MPTPLARREHATRWCTRSALQARLRHTECACYLAADLVHRALGAHKINRVDAVCWRFGLNAIAHEVGDVVVEDAGAYASGSRGTEDGAGLPLHGFINSVSGASSR
jgi:hypothetical protein